MMGRPFVVGGAGALSGDGCVRSSQSLDCARRINLRKTTFRRFDILAAIDAYVESTQQDFSVIELPSRKREAA
jgi:hypothetical protein